MKDHCFKVGDDQVYTFTNKGASGVTKNNGRRCCIVTLKEGAFWEEVLDEPGYAIEFLDGDSPSGFGCRESELQPVNTNTGE